jgi:prepilin-type N-terminal cleavage/methylation domain-containing protein
MKKQKAFTLIETLIALAIVSIVAVGFLSALTNSTRAAATTDHMDTGRAIAQGQMEYIKEQPFSAECTYSENADLISQYPGYSVAILATPVNYDSAIQKICITVKVNEKPVMTLEDYKVQ